MESQREKKDSKENKWYLAMFYERVGRAHMIEENYIAAAQSLERCIALREVIINSDNKDRAERELSLAYELAGAAYIQVDWDRGKEYLLKHNSLCKKISDRTQLLEDHMELADSYDLLLELYENGSEKTWHIMKMKEIYEQIHRHLPDNEEIIERLYYAENLYIEHEIKPKLENSESELKQFQKESNHTKAAECCEKIADSKIYIALKQNLNFEVIDEGIEHYHNAAENYKKAGQVGKAVRCYEKAVSIRQALVKSIENTEKNSHLLDVANARLGYSYLMAAETEDSERKKKEYAEEAYQIFRRLSEKHPHNENFEKFRDWMGTYL